MINYPTQLTMKKTGEPEPPSNRAAVYGGCIFVLVFCTSINWGM